MHNNKDVYFAREFFQNKQFSKAKEIFLNNDMRYEAGLCALLLRDIKSAKSIWKNTKEPCTGCLWGCIILDVICKKPFLKTPGYFQTRAFLEVYINLFLENKLYDFADALINSYKFFAKSNGETPKFIARVLYVFGYYKIVHEFSELAKNICSYDPEIHFIEAETYLMEQNYNMAFEAVENALKVAPDYFPAVDFKKRLLKSGFIN